MAQNLVVHDQDQVFVDYINHMLQVKFTLDNCRTVSHVRQNDDSTFTILAVMAFNRWDVNHCEGSIASSTPRWATWNYIHAAYEYAFNAGGRRSRINFVVSVDNDAALTLHEKIGHICEGRLVDLFGEDKDGYLYRITRREYEQSKWFNKNNNH